MLLSPVDPLKKHLVTHLSVQNTNEWIWSDEMWRLRLSLRLHCLMADNVITFPLEGGLLIDCGGMFSS